MIAVVTNSQGDKWLTNRTKANRLSIKFNNLVRSFIMLLSETEFIDDVQKTKDGTIYIVSHVVEWDKGTTIFVGRVLSPTIYDGKPDYTIQFSYNDKQLIDDGILSVKIRIMHEAEILLRQLCGKTDNMTGKVKPDWRPLWQKNLNI